MEFIVKQLPNMPALGEKCPCLTCLLQAGRLVWWMVVCEECGNKRCPKANDHRYECTGSNEPGQPGSAYPKLESKWATPMR